MLNLIIMMGRLTRDPELRYTQSQVPVFTFRIACDRDFTKSKYSNEHDVDFVDVVAWRGTADFVSKYFIKGRMAVVRGRLQIRPWTDQDGNKRYSTEIVADSVYFGDSKTKADTGESSKGSYANTYSAYGGPADDFVPDWNDTDGELPL